MKTAIDTADELATKYAQCIWWTRIPILSRRDPRLGEGKTAPAAWCELCEEVYAELPNNKSPYISAAEAAPAHIKDAHPAYWDAFIDQAYLAIRAADLWWARRRNLPTHQRLELVENPPGQALDEPPLALSHRLRRDTPRALRHRPDQGRSRPHLLTGRRRRLHPPHG